MTLDQILDDVLAREGGYVDHPSDHGGPTNRGITATVLGEWRRLGRPATVEEVRTMTEAEAREIYRRRYIERPGFMDLPEPLRTALIDFGVNSGPARAVRWLQRVLHLPVTGVLDARTRELITHVASLGHLHLAVNSLVAGRAWMVDRWTDTDPTQKPFEEGVESRALDFLDFDRSTL